MSSSESLSSKSEGLERRDRVALLFREAYARRRAIVIICEGAHLVGMKRIIARLAHILDPRHYRVHWHAARGEKNRHRPFLLPYWKALPAFGDLLILERSYYYDCILGRVSGKIGKKRYTTLIREFNDFERTLHDNGYRVLKLALDRPKKKLEKDYRKSRSRKRDPISLLDEDLEFLLKRNDGYHRYLDELLEQTAAPHAPWFRPTSAGYKQLEADVLGFLIARLEEDLDVNSMEAVKDFDDAMQRMRVQERQPVGAAGSTEDAGKDEEAPTSTGTTWKSVGVEDEDE